ncbi:ImmA/IrrE family metallo-endopeptidase [Acidiphilium sp. JA12-A1]|uniref:ImmA/IrrE family metallo-endopeptidase n=1 Tax=Acidiphilium sp. JA12-A1 TaxID=1464546 RepID=UPI000461CF25|nr:ImmA/IrrE family metallo-endopeptidase [Acidiphilium sp. JA12-A1]KDM67995.1 putative Zn peptidase [Acidiphilium sp. JA12-A1]
MNRRPLILEGAQAASDVRDQLGLDLIAPVDPYAIAEALGIRVRFLPVSMEGFYQKGNPPRIMLSALRPLARKAFTCAHEVGHHWFGHGSTIDELKADDRQDSDIPEEILANAFAGFLLMPTIGIRRAFSSRGWKPATANPLQILTIASEFGVGYETLLTHMSITLDDMPRNVRIALGKWTPQRIRKRVLGDDDADGLVVLDSKQQSASVDLDVDYALAVPIGAAVSGEVLISRQTIEGYDVYTAVSRGRATVTTPDWQVEARVAPARFTGPANYRFLEDPDE